ncbi:hypothetical protein M407DRAFT_4848 [Tulasnella calospora MUT 4182]|uniref:C2 domain-containing protein n=1 Tax=Tulasnella calospora MUT 4182 TaxID=1051891 RepID=A0A0C3QTV1_9AGAM|nr:hypothetical protein M407DRAFT_4848 [Tulasnella calospora MUT 4182]
MSGRKIGTLVVVVVRATYLHNKSLLRKQDPYCVLRLGDQTLRTNAIKHGGQRPEWNEELRFSIYETAEEELARTGGKGAADAPLPPPQTDAKAKDPSERTMHLSCYAEHFKKPDFIGETTFDPTEALRKGEMDGKGSTSNVNGLPDPGMPSIPFRIRDTLRSGPKRDLPVKCISK